MLRYMADSRRHGISQKRSHGQSALAVCAKTRLPKPAPHPVEVRVVMLSLRIAGECLDALMFDAHRAEHLRRGPAFIGFKVVDQMESSDGCNRAEHAGVNTEGPNERSDFDGTAVN